MPHFLLEVGTEELPADFMDGAIAQWQSLIPESLTEHHLTPQGVEVYATPRRLAVLITGLPSQQPNREEEIKGPPAQIAFKDGKPTPAAVGFAKKQEVDVEALELRATDKGEFVFLQKNIPGQPTTDILRELVPQWINRLEGRRFMRWGDGDLRFPRPIRWLVALWDKDILPLEIINGSEQLKSDRFSRGHRVLHPDSIVISEASNYVSCLQQAGIEVDPKTRQRQIEEQVTKAAASVQGYAEIPHELLAEVVNLVESPHGVVGKFDPEFLELPTEVIKMVMVTHQRYFPVKAEAQENSPLLPYFITISNGDPAKAEIIATGNGRVIRARLADAKFFYDSDSDEPLEAYLPSLETVTFQEDLGSIRDKVDRIIEVAEELAKQLQLSSQQWEKVERAALLCKVDLVSQMVYEFPELQGIMGQKYALKSGEDPEVAEAIFEHYLPRGAGDSLPQTLTGQVVGIADRFDTLVSIFGLGMIPTGSSDPFALRRAANGILNIAWAGNLSVNLGDLIEQFSEAFVSGNPERKSPLKDLQEFFLQRLRTLLQEEYQVDYDLVNAVLGNNDGEYTERALGDILDLRDRALFLQQIRNSQELAKIYETINRSARLAAKGSLDTQQLDPSSVVRPDLFEQSSEQAFYDGLVQLVPQTQTAQAERNYQRLVDSLAAFAPTVSRFFDGEDSVLVMDKNPAVQANRLNLLGLLRNHARVLADFGEIVK
ncbi:glycine--tRNA ligase subunit beta [Spirulina subsalsa FACHB-351]|uniref:Glycine--tRNA ligase beta subunit n=1 Tax=Spirulina subsalsa FACHB-351 TaxID=234711 RepID=A0ABT3L146_9CYAN|nr:glycine--tRNA ligase subunit beta [Spirulina subsalsa]MCW6035218.1 glycine--tRNA ligase subunit beta [Spirulina subsalsa FACHB-351]